jgi:hypothetical protein
MDVNRSQLGLVYGKHAPFPRGFSRGPAKSDGDDEWVPARPGDGP